MPQVKTVEAKIFSLEGFKVKILTAEGADVRSDKLLGGWCRTGVYGAGVIASDGG